MLQDTGIALTGAPDLDLNTIVYSSSDQKLVMGVTGCLLLSEVKKTLKFSLFGFAKKLHNVYLICMHSICKASYFHVL